MQRPDKAANEAFYATQLEERRRFDDRPEKRHAVERFLGWVVPWLRAGDRVLDVAGGGGIYASHLVRATGVSVVGVDIADAMVRQRGLDPLLPLNVVGDMEALPFADESFDAAIFVACLHHLPDPLLALREAHRVVRRGGRIFSSDPSSLTAWVRSTQPIEGEPHEFRIWVPRLAAQMRAAGFEVEQVAGRELTMRALGRIVAEPSLATYRAAERADRFLRLVPVLDRLGEVGLIRARKP